MLFLNLIFFFSFFVKLKDQSSTLFIYLFIIINTNVLESNTITECKMVINIYVAFSQHLLSACTKKYLT